MDSMWAAIIFLLNMFFLLAAHYFLNAYLYFSTTCIRPKKNGEEDAEEIRLPAIYDQIMIEGAAGKLSGYYRKGHKNKLVILIHGWMDDAKSRLEDVSPYAELGYHVLLCDLRAHGKSEGKYLGMGIADSLDLEAWVAAMEEQLGEGIEIVLDGVSFGAAAILHLNPDFLKDHITAVIADSSYDSLGKMFRKMVHFSPKFMAGFYLSGIHIWGKLLGKYSIKKDHVEINIAQITVPVLLIGGALDKLVSIDTQKKLQKACKGICELFIVERASHAKASYVDREGYENRIKLFLNTYAE